MCDKPDNSPTVLSVILMAIVALTISYLVVPETPTEREIEQRQLETYCEMVRLHQEDPTIGWPDYKNIYRKECAE